MAGQPDPPTARTLAGLCYDDLRDRFVLFGGRPHSTDANFANAQTWELSIACTADFNEDGRVDSRDVIAFLNAWTGSDPSADCDENGAVDSRDVICFLNAWVTGC